MRNLLIGLAYIVSFFSFLAGTFLSLYLFVQESFGILPHAEFVTGSPISAHTFCEWLFATMLFSSMACAFGVLKMLDRHSPRLIPVTLGDR